MSFRNKTLRNVLDELDQVEYFTCPGQKAGTSYLATTLHVLPQEVALFKHLLRKELVSRQDLGHDVDVGDILPFVQGQDVHYAAT